MMLLYTSLIGISFKFFCLKKKKFSLFFEALDIERWNLECEFNNADHRTDLNGVDRLIVRRGQLFTISLFLRSGNYQPGVSSLDCVAETGAAHTLSSLILHCKLQNIRINLLNKRSITQCNPSMSVPWIFMYISHSIIVISKDQSMNEKHCGLSSHSGC